jgi:ribosomal 50S subunit-associated protein YjgA (DUF615 family)
VSAFFRRQPWDHKYPAKRLKAIEGLNDTEVLKRLALTDASAAVRAAAVAKITVDDVLWEIIQHEQNVAVCQAAVRNVIGQKYLGMIARFRALDVETRLEAIDRITDQEILELLALGDSSKSVRIACVNKVANREILTQVMNDDRSGQVANLASQRLASGGSGRFQSSGG